MGRQSLVEWFGELFSDEFFDANDLRARIGERIDAGVGIGSVSVTPDSFRNVKDTIAAAERQSPPPAEKHEQTGQAP